VTGAAVGVPFATEHPVNTEIIKSMTIRPSHEPPAAAKPPSPGVRPRRVARSPRTASHKASRRAPPCGQPACAGQSQRRHGWGELRRSLIGASKPGTGPGTRPCARFPEAYSPTRLRGGAKIAVSAGTSPVEESVSGEAADCGELRMSDLASAA
jgi:hypothetical protein